MRKIAWLVAAVMLLTCLTACRNHSATSELEKDFVTENVNGGVKIVAYTGNHTTLEIPESIKGKRVVAIGDEVFASQYLLTEVVIPNTVTSIGRYAFFGCRALKEINIPDSVNSIGDYAFFGCWAATTLNIGESLNSMGRQAIQYCKSLEKVTVNPENKSYTAGEDGVLFTKDHSTLLCFPSSSAITEYTVPEKCTEIDDYAFRNCVNLTTVHIGAHVKEIGDGAFFASSSLKTVNIEQGGIDFLGLSVFEDCTALEEVVLPEGIKAIGYLLEDGECGKTFEGCTALTKITLPSTLTNVYAGAFDQCTALREVVFRGTQSAWKNVVIGESNAPLNAAAVSFAQG